MKRRSWLAGLAGSFWSTRRLAAANGLTPLDEAAFRRMVTEQRGKILLVDFWATWCAPCREEMPKIVGLFGAHKRDGLALVTISCDEPEQETAALEFVNKQGAPMPLYIRRGKSDDDFINAIDPNWSGALPALFLFDRNGKQVESFIGETDEKKLEVAVQKLLATS